MQRKISLDICDYTGTTLCNLYDSCNDMPGQATEVFVRTERNGHKELRFNLPSVLPDGDKNYRIDFLISDYRIRLLAPHGNDFEIDWFLISESKVTHQAFSQDYTIRASHISQLLSTKNLDLEFSDEEGNNTGTIEEIAKTILEGTGWHLADVRKFYEEEKYGYNNVEKVRSLQASAKTGAFKLMSDLCELFDAKPIYHGHGKYIDDNGDEQWGRTVDIIPLNPFSKDLEEGSIPKEVLEGENVLELYYDKNISNIARTLNTENMVTRLSGYGSYGDLSGMCSLQTATHTVLSFDELTPGEYCFGWQNSNYFFTVDATTSGLKWSTLDFTSRSYVYNGETLYKVYKEPAGQYTTVYPEESVEKNYVPYVMDFTYYQKVGLLNDDMLGVLANHQWTIPQKYIAATDAAEDLITIKEELSRTASAGEGFVKLSISSSDTDDAGNVRLTLDKTIYDGGVIYRSDYDEAKRNYFGWKAALGIKLNGEALAGKGSIIYIVRQGSPTQWVRSYVRYLGNNTDNYFVDSRNEHYELHQKSEYASSDDFPVVGVVDIIYIALDTNKYYVWADDEYREIKASDYEYGLNYFDEPDTITLWTTDNYAWRAGDEVYLFSSDSIAGLFGPREDAVLSNRKSIEETVKTVTEIHPVYFISGDTEDIQPQDIPSTDACLTSYGWYYYSNINTFEFGKLRFCYGSQGEVGWSNVYVSKNDDNPETLDPSLLPNYGYYYSMKKKMLYKSGQKWTPIKGTVDQDRLTAAFASVVDGCITQEVLTKGVKEIYRYNGQDVLPKGNYAFKNEFDNYWLFTTDMVISEPGKLRYEYANKLVWQDDDEAHVIRAIENTFSVLDFPTENELYDVLFAPGDYANRTFSTGESKMISNNIYVHENAVYECSLPAGAIVVCLNTYNTVLDEKTTAVFTAPPNTTHVRIVCNNSGEWRPSYQYAEGDTVVASGNKYYCITAHTSSQSFNSDIANWRLLTECYLHVQNYSSVLFSKNKMYKIIPCDSEGNRMGLPYLMDEFIRLSNEAYLVKLPALQTAQEDIKRADNLLMETLGDMYREGRWQQNDYTEGEEHKLYADTMDNLKEVSYPEATYDITFLDLYGSQELTEDSEPTDWPDIEITYAAHLVDKDIDINKWAYIDVIDKCYDQPWKTEIEINTRLSMIGQQSFTDVLGKIAEVANQTKANETLYKRSSALTGSGQLAADRLNGAIETNKIYIMGGTSNYYTDPKGNFIFEASDGNSAMMLGGRGLMISQEKDIYGDWMWRTALTGKGMTADAIYTGYLSAELIEAGSITTDKLSANVGQELEIGSNVALSLYATIDGVRPAGSLITQHPNETDSWIAIGAQNGDEPAYINIQSGGSVNLYGGSEINIDSHGALNLSGATVNLTSNGRMLISGGSVEVQTTGNFLVESDNFIVCRDQTTGLYNVTITGGVNATGTSRIAGYTLGVTNKGQANEVNYMYAGQTTSFDSSAQGVYLGDNGINLNGLFKVSDMGYLTSTSGEIGGWHIEPSKLSSYRKNGTDIVSNTYVGLSTAVSSNPQDINYRIWAGAQSPASAPFSVDENGNMVAKAGKIGGWTIGATTLTGNKTGIAYTTLDNDVAIWGGKVGTNDPTFYVRQDGYMKSTSGSIGGWTIGTNKLSSGSGTNYVALSSLDTDYRIWAGNETASNAKFSVSKSGYMTSTSGSIAGWSINDTTLKGNKTGLAKTQNDTDVAMWAGHATIPSSANFYVRQDGYLKATNADITGAINATSGTFTGTVSGSTITGGSININNGTFSVSTSGALTATSATITGNIQSGSSITGATISGGSININNGTFSVNASGVLNATGAVISGEITANSGNIGGWTVSNTSTVKRLSSGSGSLYVGLDSGSTGMDYAMWVGGNAPTGTNAAPFRVKRDGTLYATKFITISEPTEQYPEGQETEINLSRYALWKLSYHTVKNYTINNGYCNSVTLSNGQILNFKHAAPGDYSGIWSGQTYRVYDPDGDSVASTTVYLSTSAVGNTLGILVTHTNTSQENTIVSASGELSEDVANRKVKLTINSVDKSEISTQNTWTSGRNSVTISSIAVYGSPAATATSISVQATASNGQSDIGAINITTQRNNAHNTGGATAKCAITSGSATPGYSESVVVTAQYVNSAGTTVSTSNRVTITTPADNKGTGWTLAVGKVSLPGRGTAASMSVTVPTSTYNTSEPTSYTVSADNNYAYIMQGTTPVARASHSAYTNGANSVTVSAAGWVNGSNIVSASNGKSSVTVNLPTISLSGGTSFSSHKTTVYASGGGASTYLATKEVDATSEWNAGWLAGYAAAVGVVKQESTVITVPAASSTVGTTASSTYTIAAGAVATISGGKTAPNQVTARATAEGRALINGTLVDQAYNSTSQVFTV